MDATNPTYYGHDSDVIECIDYIQSHAFDFLEGNVIKYLTRYEQKNGVEDLKKARWYLNKLIEREENKFSEHSVSLYKSLLQEQNEINQCPPCKNLDESSRSSSECECDI